MGSQRLCEAPSSRFKLRKACYLLLPAAIAVGLSAEVSPAASDLPSNQQVVAFLTESIDWYRHRAIARQIATEPVDLVFLEDNRPVAAQIVQLSFDFARADASVAATSPAGDQKGSTAIAHRQTWRNSFSWRTMPSWADAKQPRKSRQSRRSS